MVSISMGIPLGLFIALVGGIFCLLKKQRRIAMIAIVFDLLLAGAAFLLLVLAVNSAM